MLDLDEILKGNEEPFEYELEFPSGKKGKIKLRAMSEVQRDKLSELSKNEELSQEERQNITFEVFKEIIAEPIVTEIKQMKAFNLNQQKKILVISFEKGTGNKLGEKKETQETGNLD